MGGGGGGGGGHYLPPSSDAMKRRVEAAREAELERLSFDVDALLQQFLSQINDRDAEEIQKRLAEITELLGDTAEIEALLFGGSVAKHTYVDGLSDVDALVILNRDGTQGLSPQKVLSDFHAQLSKSPPGKDVVSVEKGDLAVTIKYQDGSEVQLLPAVRSGSTVSIPDSSGKGWNQTSPRAFQKALSTQNERLGRALVPTIKLVKSLIGDLPKQQRLTGYHAEALALDAAKGYRGAKTPRALLAHVLDHASKRVLKPIGDVTGQSRSVDAYLGSANSTERRLVSEALSGIRRRLDSATSIHQWKALFGIE